MEFIGNILGGFETALDLYNVTFCLIGVLIGVVIGALPGMGPTAGIAILIPITAGLEPTTAIIMLAGLYYGSMYGSSVSAILINTPGQEAAVLTALEGHPMAKQGRAGPALSMAMIASFIGGIFGLLGLIILAPIMAEVALKFGPPEFFALMMLGLTIVISLSGNSLTKGMISGAFGLVIGFIGMDPQMGTSRFTFGSTQMLGGIDFISAVVGLFAISEILKGGEEKMASIISAKLKRVYPTRKDFKRSSRGFGIGSLTGFLVGMIPGGSASVSTFIAYDIEKKVSSDKKRFGKGNIAGIAAAESANNSATSGGLVPLLTLGIPASAPLAILLGALMVHGLNPGPQLFQENPIFVWGLLASMFVGNIMLIMLNLPFVSWWAKLARIPFPILGPAILVLCIIGTYSVRNSMFDVWVALMFGVLGYVMKKVDISAVPLVLTLVLGPMIEQNLRRSFTLSGGSPEIFFTRPLSLILLLAAMASLCLNLYSRRKGADN